MDKEIMDGYVIFPYGNNKFIRWVGKNELEIMEKKTIHISNEIIADESIDIIKYVEDKMKSETDEYKKQRDELIEDIQAHRDLLKEFSKFIDHKLYIHPGNCTYLSYRNELDQLGICKERD